MLRAFKQRGVLVLGIGVFVILTAVNMVKIIMGWETTTLQNALIAAIVTISLILVLRRHGFHPFVKKPDA